MKIYLSAFADEASKNFETQLYSLLSNNIKFIELRNINGENISKISLKKAEEYKNILDRNKINVWSLGSPLAKQFPIKSLNFEIELARHLCDISDIFECNNIRAFSFISPLKKISRNMVISKLKVITETVKNRNINYCLENDTFQYADNPERILELIHIFPDIKYIYDPANFIVSGCDSEKTIKLLSEKAYYFHVKDAKGKKIVPCGYGDANIDLLVKSINRDCVCTIEPHLFAFRGIKGFYSGSYDLSKPDIRFNVAVESFKCILKNNGFREFDGYFEK